MKKDRLIVSIGSGGNYFLRHNSLLICGINKLEDMEMFLECYKNKLDKSKIEYEVYFTNHNHYSEAYSK